jgi:hypothetical protein
MIVKSFLGGIYAEHTILYTGQLFVRTRFASMHVRLSPFSSHESPNVCLRRKINGSSYTTFLRIDIVNILHAIE